MSIRSSEIVYLVISYIGLAFQLMSLVRLADSPPTSDDPSRMQYRGLLRTAGCRVAAAVLYVMVGTNALIIGFDVLGVTLGTFCSTTVLWVVNGLLDVRLKHRLAELNKPPRHRLPQPERGSP